MNLRALFPGKRHKTQSYLWLALLFFHFTPTVLFSQEIDVALETEELNVLYRGYETRIRAVVSNAPNKEMILSSKELTISKHENGSFYSVKPIGNVKSAMITVTVVDKNDTVFVRNVHYKVLNLPEPYFYWGDSKEGGLATIGNKILAVKYPPEIPLNASFVVISWEMQIDTVVVKGTGRSLEKAESELRQKKGKQAVQIAITYMGPDGIKRTRTGFWIIDSRNATEAPKALEIKD